MSPRPNPTPHETAWYSLIQGHDDGQAVSDEPYAKP